MSSLEEEKGAAFGSSARQASDYARNGLYGYDSIKSTFLNNESEYSEGSNKFSHIKIYKGDKKQAMKQIKVNSFKIYTIINKIFSIKE